MTKVTQLLVAEVDSECRTEPGGDNRADLEGKMEDNWHKIDTLCTGSPGAV